MNKRIKYVVAIVLKPTIHSSQFLIVKRPEDDPDLKGEWGLPAVTMMDYELPEIAARRVCREKLNCDAECTKFFGIMFQKRNSYDIFLMDIEMAIVGSKQPDIMQAVTEHTAYIEQKWSYNPMDLMNSAKHGSCCSSIFLSEKGLLDRAEWVGSLEGSDVVA